MISYSCFYQYPEITNTASGIKKYNVIIFVPVNFSMNNKNTDKNYFD